MSDTTNPISIFVKNQFPAFFNVEGPRFVAFVEAYYEWLEQQGNVIQRSRMLTDIRDVDNTLVEFLSHFREKYLLGVPLTSKASLRDLVKHAVSLYRAKGTTKAVEFLFLLLFNEDVTIYYPSRDVLRPSDGTWVVPRYLELSRTDKTFGFVGRTILGTESGATALVERVDRRSIDSKVFDVAYLSQIKGSFQTGEYVVQQSTGDIQDAPIVIGSLTQIDIMSPGKDFNIGDIVQVISTNLGQEGKARVTGVEDATGRVNFTLEDGGSGYTNAASVLVSDRVLGLTNFVYAPPPSPTEPSPTEFSLRETITQPIINVAFTAAAGFTVSVGSTVEVYDVGTPGTMLGNGNVIAVNSTHLLVQNAYGTFSTSGSPGVNRIRLLNDAASNTNVTSTSNLAATGQFIQANTSHIGVKNVINMFYANGAFIKSDVTGITANVVTISTGQDATFSIGQLGDTENVYLNTDMLKANNTPLSNYINVSFTSASATFTSNVENGGLTLYAFNSSDVVQANGKISASNTGYVVVQNTGGSWVGSGVTKISTTDPPGAANATVTATVATANVPYRFLKLNSDQYGFPKLAVGNSTFILNRVLTVNTFTIGTIESIVGINPGIQYNTDPLVRVIEDRIAPFERGNLLLTISNLNGTFRAGEDIEQVYSETYAVLNIVGATGTFAIGETIRQDTGGGTYRYAEIVSGNNTILTVTSETTAFTSGVIEARWDPTETPITATVTGRTTTNQLRTTKGSVITANSSAITLKRKRFATSFLSGTPVTGESSGATASVTSVTAIEGSPVMGDNAVVTANAGTANGTLTSIEIIDSGLSYYEGETVTLIANNNNFIATGVVRLLTQGLGEGSWTSDQGFLNLKYIHDNDYYQDYSYEIQSSLSLDRYAEIVRQVAHVAGTKMFGRVFVKSDIEIELDVDSTVEMRSAILGNPTLVLDFENDFYYVGG